jgi:hypothetical protein
VAAFAIVGNPRRFRPFAADRRRLFAARSIPRRVRHGIAGGDGYRDAEAGSRGATVRHSWPLPSSGHQPRLTHATGVGSADDAPQRAPSRQHCIRTVNAW